MGDTATVVTCPHWARVLHVREPVPGKPVQLTLDTGAGSTPAPIPPPTAEPKPETQPVSALEILLDGVETRVRRTRER